MARKLPLYLPGKGLAEGGLRIALEEEPSRALDPGCRRCKLHVGVKTVCIPADGEPGGVLIVGLYPGREEDACARVNAGPSGKYLRAQVGRHWGGPVAYANALSCYPGSQKITSPMVDACRGFLAGTFREAVPTRILALGSLAAEAVLGRAVPPLSVRGGASWTEGGIPVFVLMHPAAAMRNRFLRAWFEEDLERALTCAPEWGSPKDATYRLVETQADAEEARAELSAAGTFAYDCEWAGRAYSKDFVVSNVSCCAIGTDDGWVWDAWAMQDPLRTAALAKLMADPAVAKVGSNLASDVHAVERYLGVPVRNQLSDVRLKRKLLDADADGDLKVMAELVGMGGHKAEADACVPDLAGTMRKAIKARAGRQLTLGRGFDRLFPDVPARTEEAAMLQAAAEMGMAEDAETNRAGSERAYALAVLPPGVAARYNMRDSVATARLEVWAERRMAKDDPGIRRIWDLVVRRAMSAVQRIEAWGILVDRAAIRAAQAHVQMRIDAVQARLTVYAPTPQFNWESGTQLADLFYRQLSLPVPHLTDGGSPSTDEEALGKLRGKHPAIDDLLELRGLRKLKSTYLDGVVMALDSDGRIHGYILLDGAATGRASMMNPNCFDAATEILTPRGWVALPELSGGDQVAQWWPGGCIDFVRPEIVSRAALETMVTIQNKHIDLRVTADHRCLLRNRKTGELRVFSASAYPQDWEQIHGGQFVGGPGLDLSDAELRLVVATQADGSWADSSSGIDFAFHKARKVVRLRSLLDASGAAYGFRQAGRKSRFSVRVCPVSKKIKNLLGPQKKFGAWVFQLSRAQIDIVAEEVFHWDGLLSRRTMYSSSVRENADLIQALLVLSGKRVNLREYMPQSGRINYQLDVTHRDCSMTTNVSKVVATPLAERTFCVSVPSSYVVVRRSGKVCVTGQCQNIPRADTPDGKMIRNCFVAPLGWVLVELDFGTLEPRVAAILSGDPVLRGVFERGEDFHRATAQIIAPYLWPGNAKLLDGTWAISKDQRQEAKPVGLAALYGKMARAMAATLSCTVATAQSVLDAVMGRYKVLAGWIGDALAFTRRSGYCRTWWAGQPARRRPLTRVADPDEGARGTAERGSYNGPIQGTGADFLTASLAELVRLVEEEALPARIVLPVHDSVLAEVRIEDVDEYVEVASAAMTGHDSGGVPLVVDCKVGTSWGSMMDLKEWRKQQAAGHVAPGVRKRAQA